MGHITHNAIVVTTYTPELARSAARKAREFGCQVLGPGRALVNGHQSMLVCPDGSKEGWPESGDGDERRAKFRDWLDSRRFEDGSNRYEWAEVQYGSDDASARVVEHAWKRANRRTRGSR